MPPAYPVRLRAPHHPMAGDDDGDRVVAYGASYRLGGHAFQTLFFCNAGGNFPIGHGLAIGNLQENLPNPLAEGEPWGDRGGVKGGFFPWK